MYSLQYVRVMARGAQCAENGPFFSTTPRTVIQNGMAISQDILIMPDWLLIGLMMASLLLLMIILVIGLVGSAILLFRVSLICTHRNILLDENMQHWRMCILGFAHPALRRLAFTFFKLLYYKYQYKVKFNTFLFPFRVDNFLAFSFLS